MSPKRPVELCDCLTPKGISVQSPITTKSNLKLKTPVLTKVGTGIFLLRRLSR